LLSNNKLATVDDLNKKGMAKPEAFCFCLEKENIAHLFFNCVVARAIWECVGKFLGINIGKDYISVASKWLKKKSVM
jgi:hypothetical protein